MKEIIVLLGVIGSGKTHTANQIIKENPEKKYKIINFADSLKDIASDILDVDMFDDHYKSVGWFLTEDEYFTGRDMLQRLGKSVRNHIGRDTWAKAWVKRVKKELKDGNSVICADCRYINELEHVSAIRCARDEGLPIVDNIRIIFCDFKSGRYDDKNTHESEHLAQDMKLIGYKDQEEVSLNDLMMVFRKNEEDSKCCEYKISSTTITSHIKVVE